MCQLVLVFLAPISHSSFFPLSFQILHWLFVSLFLSKRLCPHANTSVHTTWKTGTVQTDIISTLRSPIKIWWSTTGYRSGRVSNELMPSQSCVRTTPSTACRAVPTHSSRTRSSATSGALTASSSATAEPLMTSSLITNTQTHPATRVVLPSLGAVT